MIPERSAMLAEALREPDCRNEGGHKIAALAHRVG